MMNPMRFHPGPGFGFESIMANVDFGHFRRWYDANSFFVPGRERVAVAVGEPEFAQAA